MTDHDPRHEERPPDARPFPRGRDAMRAPVVDRAPSTGAGGGAFYLMAGLLFYNPGTLDQLDQARQSIKVQE